MAVVEKSDQLAMAKDNRIPHVPLETHSLPFWTPNVNNYVVHSSLVPLTLNLPLFPLSLSSHQSSTFGFPTPVINNYCDDNLPAATMTVFPLHCFPLLTSYRRKSTNANPPQHDEYLHHLQLRFAYPWL